MRREEDPYQEGSQSFLLRESILNKRASRRIEVHHSQKSQFLENISCQYGNKCHQVCISEKCEKRPVICTDKKCQCRKGHKKLSCAWLDPELIFEEITLKSSRNQKQVKEIERKFDHIIDQISELKDQAKQQLKSVGISKIQKQFLDCFEKNQLDDRLTGKKINKILRGLQKSIVCDLPPNQKLLKSINQTWKGISDNIREHCQSLPIILSSQYLEGSLEHMARCCKIESKIILTVQQQSVLQNLFERPPKSFKLLYRASENNFEVKKFWSKCKYRENTITIVRTDKEKIIGGFISDSWKKEHFQWDQPNGGQSFVFSISENAKFI